MLTPSPTQIELLKKTWSDRLVRVRPGSRPELTRFETMVGRVVTVNWSGRAVIDFADGAWYDVTDFESVLTMITDDSETKSFDRTANSAQPKPTRQG
jgi:hypothetical protein